MEWALKYLYLFWFEGSIIYLMIPNFSRHFSQLKSSRKQLSKKSRKSEQENWFINNGDFWFYTDS